MKMLIVFPPIFVAETKILKGYNFVTPLAAVRSKIYVWISGYLHLNYLWDSRPGPGKPYCIISY